MSFASGRRAAEARGQPRPKKIEIIVKAVMARAARARGENEGRLLVILVVPSYPAESAKASTLQVAGSGADPAGRGSGPSPQTPLSVELPTVAVPLAVVIVSIWLCTISRLDPQMSPSTRGPSRFRSRDPIAVRTPVDVFTEYRVPVPLKRPGPAEVWPKFPLL